jgi:hypothetical protein
LSASSLLVPGGSERRSPALIPGMIDIVNWLKLYEALFNALGAFVVVNLGGLLFLGTRGVFRWIRAARDWVAPARHRAGTLPESLPEPMRLGPR